MNNTYYCTYCEKSWYGNVNTHLSEISDRYSNYDSDDNVVSIEYHGMCLDCIECADKDYWSNWNYHQSLLI